MNASVVFYDIGPCFTVVARSIYGLGLFRERRQYHAVITVQAAVQLERWDTTEEVTK